MTPSPHHQQHGSGSYGVWEFGLALIGGLFLFLSSIRLELSHNPYHILETCVYLYHSTCVAGINHWQSDNGIRFCSMDLGGDDVYRVLHQYFLDKDALFILAYDHRKFNGYVSRH